MVLFPWDMSGWFGFFTWEIQRSYGFVPWEMLRWYGFHLGRHKDGMVFTLGDVDMIWCFYLGRCKDGLVYHLGRRWYSLVAIPWETYIWFDLRVPWETLVLFDFFPWETSNPLGDVDVSQGGTTSPKENHTSPKVNFPWETYQTLSKFYKENQFYP